jgi:hypothetical protein
MRAPRTRSASRRRLKGIVVTAATLTLVGGAITVGEATAASDAATASTQLSLHAAPDVLSVTVSPSSGSFGFCHGGDSTSSTELGFPNGDCQMHGLVLTNTGLPGHMMVTGGPMSPVGGGTSWVLCGSSDGIAPICSGASRPGIKSVPPGAEQYSLATTTPTGGVLLSTQPQCDRAFGSGGTCAAAPGQSSTENLLLLGPESTGNGASNYTTIVTWTVTP